MTTSAARPLFSVIIPTCRRPDLLAECLTLLVPGAQEEVRHLANAEASTADGALTYEVLVTDDRADASAQGLVENQFPWARWTQGPQHGPAANRNHGAAHATGEWLVFLDDDCLPSAGWLAAYARALQSTPKALVLEGKTIAPRKRERFLETAPINEAGGHLWACNFAIRRDFFEEIGGFDTRFPHAAMEDSELHKRIQARIGTVPFVPEAVVVHPWRRVDAVRTFFVQRQSELIYAGLHPDAAHLRMPAFWLRYYLRAFVKETPGDWLRYPLEMLRIQPIYALLQVLHLWALFMGKGPEYFAGWVNRIDRARARTTAHA